MAADTAIATAWVALRADGKKLPDDTTAAIKSIDADKHGKDVGGRFVSGFGGALGKLGGIMAGAFAGVAVVSGLKDIIGKASDLNETVNKTNVIFGENAKAIQNWAKDSAKQFGLSRKEALEAASGFGNMFQQIGFAGDAALDMSKQVVQLSTDLGSFNNLPTAEVADMMSAAFRGEYDSLQRLIPNINATRVEQEAMAATGKTTAKELTAQEKATAVLAIVTRDGAAALNDFAETSGGLAGQQKILQASIDDLKTKFGEILLPAVTAVVDWMGPKLIAAGEGLIAFWEGTLSPGIEALVRGFQNPEFTPGQGGFEQFMQNVGKAAADVKTAFEDFVNWLRDDGLPFLADKLGPVLKSTRDTLDEIKVTLSDNKENLEKWKAAAEPILPLLAGITGLIIGFVRLMIEWYGVLTRQWTIFFGNVADGFSNIWQIAVTVFEGILKVGTTALSFLPWWRDDLQNAARGFGTFKDQVNKELDAITPSKTVELRAAFGGDTANLVELVKRGSITAATGGAIHGPGTGTSDSIPARLSNGEHVWTAREVSAAGGHSAVEAIRRGALRGFAAGGGVRFTGGDDTVGVVRRKVGEFNQVMDLAAAGLAKGIRSLASAATGVIGQSGGAGGSGWQWQMSVLRAAFPGLALISGYRPGAITSTGNPSYHGAGRAVDIPPRFDVFNWIAANYGASTKELIFTPAGGRQIHNGRPHVFSGGTIVRDHLNHVHWAYDQGGWLPPGLSPAYNGTGRPERVLGPDSAIDLSVQTIERLAAMIVNMMRLGITQSNSAVARQVAYGRMP